MTGFLPWVWEWSHLAVRNDSQHLSLCVCHVFKRDWKDTESPKAAFCPSWGRLWLLHLLQSQGDAAVLSQDTRWKHHQQKLSLRLSLLLYSNFSFWTFSTWQSHLRQVPAASPASSKARGACLAQYNVYRLYKCKDYFCVSTVRCLSKQISYLMLFGFWLLQVWILLSLLLYQKEPTAINNSLCLLSSVKVHFLNCGSLLCVRFHICLNFSPAGCFEFPGIEVCTVVNHGVLWMENFTSSAIWVAFKYISKETIPSFLGFFFLRKLLCGEGMTMNRRFVEREWINKGTIKY